MGSSPIDDMPTIDNFLKGLPVYLRNIEAMALRDKAVGADSEMVTREEFIRRCVKVGMEPDEAEIRVNLASALGSAILIGEEKLTIKSI